MSNLTDIKRPSIAIIKVVEAIGILLRVPVSYTKSIFKAPVPSNYDATVNMLEKDFYGILNSLSALHSNGIPNEIASLLYSKTLEPGFDYEVALKQGGLATRELFNLLVLLIQQLQSDEFRIPVKTKNILFISDGSLSSYVAFDCLSHIHNHGSFTILSLSDTTRTEENYPILANHVPSDLLRRCELQYKKPSHQFQLIDLQKQSDGDIIQLVHKHVKESESDIVLVGLEALKYNESDFSDYAKSLPDLVNKTIIYGKSSSRVLPFDSLLMSRRFMACVKSADDLSNIFFRSLELMRPEDTICVVCIYESRQPKGDYRDTRFGFGESYSWIQGDQKKPAKYSYPGWNDEYLQNLRGKILELFSLGQVNGDIRIEEESITTTIAQEICRISAEERADFIVMKRGVDREVSSECIRECTCSIALLE